MIYERKEFRSLQTFKDINKLVDVYELPSIVHSFSPKKELRFETEDAQMKQLLGEFLEIVDGFLKRKDYLSTTRGTLEWLDLIYRTLEAEWKIIRVVGEKNYPKYDDEKTRWIVEFAVDSMVVIIQRTQKWISKQAGLFKKTRRQHPSLRRYVSLVLSNLQFSLFSIIFTIIRVEAGETKPQDLYSVVGESLYRTKRFG